MYSVLQIPLKRRYSCQDPNKGWSEDHIVCMEKKNKQRWGIPVIITHRRQNNIQWNPCELPQTVSCSSNDYMLEDALDQGPPTSIVVPHCDEAIGQITPISTSVCTVLSVASITTDTGKSTRQRVLPAAAKLNDLFAFDAKYHRSCYGHYINDCNIKAACSKTARLHLRRKKQKPVMRNRFKLCRMKQRNQC